MSSQLKKRGSNLKSLCPRYEESTISSTAFHCRPYRAVRSSQEEQFDTFYTRFLESDLGRIYQAVPWDDLVSAFGLKESKKGPKSFFCGQGKLALMFLKHYGSCSDRRLMEQLNGNIGWQFFCSIYLGTDRLTNFKIISEIRTELAGKLDMDKVQQAFFAHWSPHMADKHSITMDATCYESYLRYPTNVKLLWECVDWLHHLMRDTCRELGVALPRSKYLKWKKRYISYSKMRRKTEKKKRALTRSLLLLLDKISGELDRLEGEHGMIMTRGQYRRRATARKIHAQQYPYFHRGQKPKDRIVSLDKDYLRPIVRGKEKKPVEFGAKVNKFQIDGISFIEHLSFDSFHEGNRFTDTIFKAQRLTRTKIRLAGATAFGLMDDLVYEYVGNQLQKVTDGSFVNQGFNDQFTSIEDYRYDPNGNLTIDANKGITGITYNHLNLPEQVTFNSGNIQYVYDANGTKLKKTVSTTGTETLYANGYIYEGNTLQFFPHPEGYVMPNTSGGFDYVYNYKDHVDNIRLSYTDANGDGDITTNEIIKESNFYPFGLSHKGYNSNVSSLGNSVAKRFMFGSKELDESLGLGTYDFGGRNYNPDLGRWMNMDPLAEGMRRHSPYNYAFDNPIFFLDPDGMMPCPTGDCDSFFAGMVQVAKQFNQNLADRGERFVDNPIKSINKGLADTGGFLADVTNISGIMGEENQLYNQIGETANKIANFSDLSNKEKGALFMGGVVVVAEIAVTKKTKPGAGSVASLSDDALVVRGGANKASNFDGGRGVFSRLSDQKLDGISVNSKINATLEELSQGIPHNKVGVTTVGDVRKAGGDVLSSPTKNNPNHATMSIPNSEIAAELMKIFNNPTKQ